MKVLVTAGPTWVKVDRVRVLTNIFTGRTGLDLARELKKRGYAVTLLINPHCLGRIHGRNVVRYRYFGEFKRSICRLLDKNTFTAIVHTAAVSDYELTESFKGKISSGRKSLKLHLKPAPKIIKTIRVRAKKSLLIQFKLETGGSGLVESAYRSLKENHSDFVVANALSDLERGYQAFFIDREKRVSVVRSKVALANVIDCAIRRLKT